MANTTGKKFGGRKKGTPNKDTGELREKINILLNEQWDKLLTDIDGLAPKERVDTMVRLLEYALPKLNRTEIEQSTTLEDMLRYSPEERRQRILELSRLIENEPKKLKRA